MRFSIVYSFDVAKGVCHLVVQARQPLAMGRALGKSTPERLDPRSETANDLLCRLCPPFRFQETNKIEIAQSPSFVKGRNMQLFEGRFMNLDGATKLLLGIIRTPGINEDLGQQAMRVCQEMPINELLRRTNREPLKGVDRLTERSLDVPAMLGGWPPVECQVAESMPKGLDRLEIIGTLLNQSPIEQDRLLEGRRCGCGFPNTVESISQFPEGLGQSPAKVRILRRIRSHRFQVRENGGKFLA